MIRLISAMTMGKLSYFQKMKYPSFHFFVQRTPTLNYRESLSAVKCNTAALLVHTPKGVVAFTLFIKVLLLP